MVDSDGESVGTVAPVGPDPVSPSPEKQNQRREMEHLAKEVMEKVARRIGIVAMVVVLA